MLELLMNEAVATALLNAPVRAAMAFTTTVFVSVKGFTVFSDVTSAATLSTNNSAALNANGFVLGGDYVVFSNILVGAGGIITFSYTANVNVTSPDYFGANSFASFNGLQLVQAPPPNPGPRPIEIDALLTGNGTVTYDSGATDFTGDLRVTGTANTFSGQWNVQQGALLGSGSDSLGANVITVGAGGALETAYNVNDTAAGLILNGQMCSVWISKWTTGRFASTHKSATLLPA
jgi:autotransporter-associated beta strand protein